MHIIKKVLPTAGLTFSIVTILYSFYSLWRIITHFAPDFNVFYTSAFDVTHHISPYADTHIFTGLGYPLVTTIFFFPFLLFPYQISQGIFVVLSFLAIPVIIFLCYKLLQQPLSWYEFFVVFALILFSFPTKFTLGMGQSNLIAYVLLLLTFYLYQKNRQISSGIIFAFAMLLKPIFGFFLLFFFLKNQWKLVFISIGAGLTIFLIFSLLFPQKQFGTEYYVFSFVPHLLNPSGREIYYNQGIIGFVARLMPNLFLRVGVDALYSVLLLTFLYLERKKQHNYVFSLFLISLVLIDTLSWQHHFVFLIFPFLFIGKRLLKSGTLLEKTLLICSYFLISGNIKNHSIFASFPSSLVLSHVFYGAIILFWLVISNRNISGKTTSLSAPQAKSKK